MAYGMVRIIGHIFFCVRGFAINSGFQFPFNRKRFVDDIISAVSRNDIDILLQHLNSIEPSIQFTVERETNGDLAFLDLNVYRTIEGKLETAVYRKPTHTDKYLSYNSHHPVSHKKSVAKTLLQRAEHLPSMKAS